MINKLLFTFILIPLLLYSQLKEVKPELLFTIGYNYFPQYGSHNEDIFAAKALEYYENHLYLSFEDKILKLSTQGDVIKTIYPPQDVRISDIVFYKNQLVVFSSDYFDNLIYYDSSTIQKTEYVNFSATNESDLTILSSDYLVRFEPKYLINVGGDLLFHDGTSYFPYSYLHSIKIKSHPQLLGKTVLINKEKRRSIYGYPISDCESIWSSFNKGLPSNEYSFALTDYYNDSTVIYSGSLSYDTCESCLIYIDSFFKNEYLTNYFFYGFRMLDSTSITTGEEIVVFLDNNFELFLICKEVEYLGGKYGPSPHYIASFTYDEMGNVYYCTNYLDYSTRNNSFAKIYKIGAAQY